MSSLSTDVRNEIKAAQKLRLRWWGVLMWMAFCLPVIVLSDHFGRLDMSRPILNCIAVFGFMFVFKWRLRRHAWFWITMTVIVALHVPLILFVPWGTRWVPALAIAAIDSVDFCLILWILSVVGKFMEGPKTAER
jgi:hypothetical protein